MSALGITMTRAADWRAELDAYDRALADRVAEGAVVLGRYAVSCSACGADFRGHEAEHLLARARSALSPESMASFLAFARDFDPEDHHRPPVHVDSVHGFVAGLATFLREHGPHGVEAWVEPL